MADIVARLRFLASGQDDPHSVELAAAADEIERLREVLRKCLPVMRKSHDRIHCLPRTSDTDLAEAIDIALGVARAALGEKE